MRRSIRILRFVKKLLKFVLSEGRCHFLTDHSKQALNTHWKTNMAGCEESCGFYFVFALFTFFVWMDMSFFDELQEYGSFYNTTVAETLMFPAKTVKVRLQDHTSHYINLPLMQMLDDKLGISDIPGVTPNLITGIHLAFAIVAAKCFISGSLCIRRLGVILYEMRYQLDLLDGVVYRAQQKIKHQYTSGWGTVGYLVDAFADFCGGILVAVSCTIFLNRYLPLKRVRGKAYDEERGRNGESEVAKLIHVSRRSVNIKMVLVTLQIMARSALWDYYCHAYHDLLEAQRPDIPRVSISVTFSLHLPPPLLMAYARS